MKKILLLSVVLLFVVWCVPAFATVAADDLPITAPLAKVGNSLAFSVVPILLRIALVIACLLIVLTRSFGAMGGLLAVIVGGTLAIKGDAVFAYLGWGGTLF